MIGYIYKITPNDCGEFYIGSTNDMKVREKKHRADAKSDKRKLYETIREMGGFDMELLYEYKCENETELRMEEQRCMDKLQPTLNINRAYNSEEETIERHNKQSKQRYERNKDAILERHKQYRDQHKTETAQYYEQNKDVLRKKQKQYRETNKDVIREKRKQQYETNKDAIREKSKQLVKCECGCEITQTHLRRHQKTKKHRVALEQLKIMIDRINELMDDADK